MPKQSTNAISARDKGRIDDILEAIEHIKRYTHGVSESKFLLEPMLQDAVIRRLMIIGEAASKLSAQTRARHADIPWSMIIGMRNILIHDYNRSDISLLWSTVKNDLPALQKALK
jgi:uncharacterized protein with HEPN domain